MLLLALVPWKTKGASAMALVDERGYDCTTSGSGGGANGRS